MKRVRWLAFAGALVAMTPMILVMIPAAEASTGTLRITESYTLPEDHQGDIVIEQNDVVLDCAGHTVSGPDSIAAGIELTGLTGVTIKTVFSTASIPG